MFRRCVTRSMSFWFTLLATISLASPLSSVHADITPIGDVEPDPSTWTSSTDGYIGNTASGTLTVDGGSGLLSGDGYIGNNSGSVGVATITGTGSTWTTTQYGFDVGFVGGSGTVSITQGGNLSTTNTNSSIGYYPGAMGVVKIDGTGSTWTYGSGIYVGYLGAGTISITNGGTLVSQYASSTCIGFDGGASGVVHVDGVGSTWTSSDAVYVGGGPNSFSGGSIGSGTLLITGGGRVSDTAGNIGNDSVGVVTVDGAGSTWVNTNDLAIGNSGTGMLSITNGGSVSSRSGSIGTDFWSSGVVAVAGTGSIWTTGTLFLGGDQTNLAGRTPGSARVSIAQGGVVNSSNGYIAGVVTVDGIGSTWTNSGNLFVGNSGGGTLSITGGGRVSSNNSYLGYYATTSFSSTGLLALDGAGSTWTNSGNLYVGNSGSGTLSVTNGGTAVSDASAYIGYRSGSTGLVTVDGAGSNWINAGAVYVGNSGGGTLSITNGGSVAASGETWVGTYVGCTGSINFGSNGGTLTTQSLIASPTQLTGTGTVVAHGLLSDINLIFDSAHPLQHMLTIQQPGQNIAVNLDLASNPTGNGTLGAGLFGTGSLTIRDGIQVTSALGYLGYYINSKGIVAVDGAGSAWTDSSGLYVGRKGSGTLSISGGGSVTATTTAISSTSLLAIDVGRGSSLVVSNGGTLSNSGVIRFLAGAGVPADGIAYSPISATTWSGTGTYQAIGGTWSSTSHTFTASGVTAGTSGLAVALTLSSVQRAAR